MHSRLYTKYLYWTILAILKMLKWQMKPLQPHCQYQVIVWWNSQCAEKKLILLCIVNVVFVSTTLYFFVFNTLYFCVALACMQFNLQCNNVPILCLSCFSLFGRAGNRWDGTGGHSHSPALFFFSSFRDSLSANQEAWLTGLDQSESVFYWNNHRGLITMERVADFTGRPYVTLLFLMKL